MSYTKRVHKRQLTQVPSHVHGGLQYEVIMGSFAYGVSNDTSDIDIYGFSIPNKDIIFPHLTGNYIFGFDKTVPHNFEQWQQHHVKDPEKRKEYDFCIYNITKYFILCANGNPNMIDSLFVPTTCITHITPLGEMVRDNRHLFLSKKCWHTFKGYAFSQMHKMNTKNPEGKRKETIEKYGYDVKYAYHLVRLLNEVEEILTECDLDLQRNREQLKAIRRGEWTQDEIKEYFSDKERYLEEEYLKSHLPHKPKLGAIRDLLFKCLEFYFDEGVRPETDKEIATKLYHEISSTLHRFHKKIYPKGE